MGAQQVVSPHERDSSHAAVVGWEFTVALLAIMFAVGVATLVGSAITHGPWWFSVLFLGLVAYLAYGFLHHRAYRVQIADGVLSWHGFRYHGSRPMSEVEAVVLGKHGLVAWRFRDGTAMQMMTFQSVGRQRPLAVRFLDEVGRQYPGLIVPG
jgi:hypothetical protein